MNNSLVSIIVPVYNGEKYIQECLESIQRQRYERIECIVVDDGSTDDSLSIVNKFVKADDRFRVISKDNQGVSYAISRGVQEAKGDWFYFIDCDDWMDDDEIERLYKCVTNQKCDMVVSEYIIEDKRPYCRAIVRFRGVVERAAYEKVMFSQFLCSNRYNEIVCGNGRYGKLIRSDLVKNNVHFQSGLVFAEDAVLLLGVLLDCDRVCTEMSKAGYHYRQHELSMMHNCDDKYAIYRARYAQRVWKLYEEKGISDNQILLKNYYQFNMFSLIGALKKVNFNMEILRQEQAEGFAWIMDTLEMLCRQKHNLGIRDRILLWLLTHEQYGILSAAHRINHFLVYVLKI